LTGIILRERGPNAVQLEVLAKNLFFPAFWEQLQTQLTRGTILTVAARARLLIIGFRYALPRYFTR
jgi:hypothetical protein